MPKLIWTVSDLIEINFTRYDKAKTLGMVKTKTLVIVNLKTLFTIKSKTLAIIESKPLVSSHIKSEDTSYYKV